MIQQCIIVPVPNDSVFIITYLCYNYSFLRDIYSVEDTINPNLSTYKPQMGAVL